MPPEAVLFDLDGTLVDSERDNIESVVLAVRALGVEIDDDDRRFIVGHSWNEIHARLALRHGLRQPIAEVIARAVAERRTLADAHGYVALPGAVAAVRRLGERAPLALVSGGSRVEVEDAVRGLGLWGAFAAIFAAQDYARGKPDPEPYLKAMAALGARPELSIVIEDAEPGVVSGRAAGARVIGVRAGNFSGYDLTAAHAVVDALDDVTHDLCDRLLAG